MPSTRALGLAPDAFTVDLRQGGSDKSGASRTSASLIGAALWWITPFTLWQAGLIALIINLMGFLGGLVRSAIKRDRGVKDWDR